MADVNPSNNPLLGQHPSFYTHFAKKLVGKRKVGVVDNEPEKGRARQNGENKLDSLSRENFLSYNHLLMCFYILLLRYLEKEEWLGCCRPEVDRRGISLPANCTSFRKYLCHNIHSDYYYYLALGWELNEHLIEERVGSSPSRKIMLSWCWVTLFLFIFLRMYKKKEEQYSAVWWAGLFIPSHRNFHQQDDGK